MPYLLPDDLDPTEFKCLTIRIPDDPQWETVFWGALLELGKWFNHDRDALHKGKIVADKWRGWIEDAMACDTITNIRVQNNRIQVQFCNSETWVTMGAVMQGGIRYQGGKIEYDFDGDGTFDISFYSDITKNIYGQSGIPITSDLDRICRASWILARAFSDDYHDLFLTISSASNIIGSALEMLVSWGVVTQIAEETIEFFTTTIPATALTWMTEKIKDPETISFLAELIYCSLVQVYPDNLNNIFNNIELGIYQPITIIAGDNTVQWPNFGDIVTSIYNTFTTKNVAYGIIAYAVVSDAAIRHVVRLTTPVQQTLEYALRTAEYFDNRECENFGCNTWQQILYFNSPFIEVTKGTVEGQSLDSECEATPWIGANYRRQVAEFNIPPISGGGYTITRIFIIGGQNPLDQRILYDFPPVNEIASLGSQSGPDLSSDYTDLDLDSFFTWWASPIKPDFDCSGSFQMSQVTVYGTGENPFI